MKNIDKYKTAQERAEAFYKFCNPNCMTDDYGRCSLDCPLKKHDNDIVDFGVCHFYWLYLEADLDLECEEEKPSFSVSKSCNIQIGDTVAYKTMDDNKEEWACFTVRAMDNEYFYEHIDHSGDNIAKGCCHKVNVDRVRVEDEKPLPCPFCGSECELLGVEGEDWKVLCMNSKGPCYYTSAFKQTKEDAIAAHNRVAKKCREVKE